MNTMKNISKLAVVNLLILVLFSCEKDDEPKVLNTGDIIITSRLINPDGFSGSAYMQIIDDINPAEYDNNTAFPSSWSVTPVVIGNDVYVLPGWSDQTNKLEKYTLVNGNLEKQGEYLLPTGSGAINCVTKGDKAYISLNYLGKLLIINHKTMEKITELDLSQYGVGDNNPDPAIMLIRDNLLYVGLNQLVNGFSSDPMRPMVDILIIDTDTDQILKMITDSTSGMSMPTHPESDFKSIFMDENKDIYINCVSGFGFIGHKAGFLRIKAGETEFDDSYSFDVTQTDVEGEEFSPSYIMRVQYAGNGKMYANGDILERYSMPEPNFFEDRTAICLEIDLKAKTLKKLNLPHSNILWNWGRAL